MYLGSGFLNKGSSEGLRSLAASMPVSVRSFSRDGEGLSDFEAVDVGSGSLEANRGIPLGRADNFCCLSISTSHKT